MTHFVRQQPALQLNNANAVEEYSARGVRFACASALASLGFSGMQQGTPWVFNQQASGNSLSSALRYAKFDDATFNALNATGAFAGFDVFLGADVTSSGAKLSGGAAGVAATGSILFNSNPVPSSGIVLGGSILVFVSSGASGNQCNIGVNLAATMTNLVAVCSGSADANISLCTYAQSGGNTLNITYGTTGTAGNSWVITVSTDTFVPSCYNRGVHAEAWAMCGDSITWGAVDNESISQQTWAQPVVGRSDPYIYVSDGQWTNESSMVWSRRHWNRASRICWRLSAGGRYQYQVPGTSSGGPLSWDISPGWDQCLAVAPQQTLGFLLALGRNIFDPTDSGWKTGSATDAGNKFFGTPQTNIVLNTVGDTPSGSVLTFASNAGVFDGYQVTGLNISQAPGGTPLAPADSRNTYVTLATLVGGNPSTTVTLSQNILGDIPNNTPITFIAPNMIDHFVRPAVALLRGFYPNRSKTKIAVAVPIACNSGVPSYFASEMDAFGTYLNNHIGVDLDIDAVADTRQLPMFNCNVPSNANNTTYYRGDAIHPNALGNQILGGGLQVDGVTPGFSAGSFTWAIERAMGRV